MVRQQKRVSHLKRSAKCKRAHGASAKACEALEAECKVQKGTWCVSKSMSGTRSGVQDGR